MMNAFLAAMDDQRFRSCAATASQKMHSGWFPLAASFMY